MREQYVPMILNEELSFKKNWDPITKPWYIDRDFPEVKSSNADVVASIIRKENLHRVIDTHNALIDRLNRAEEERDVYHKQLMEAEEKITELRAQLATAQDDLKIAQTVIDYNFESAEKWKTEALTFQEKLDEPMSFEKLRHDPEFMQELVKLQTEEMKAMQKKIDQLECDLIDARFEAKVR